MAPRPHTAAHEIRASSRSSISFSIQPRRASSELRTAAKLPGRAGNARSAPSSSFVISRGTLANRYPGQVHEREPAVDLIEIDHLRTTRPGTGARQPVGLPPARSAGWICRRCCGPERQPPVALRRKLLRPGCTYYKRSGTGSWSVIRGPWCAARQLRHDHAPRTS